LVTTVFLLIAVFISLANRYDSVIAGLVLAGAFAVIALVAIATCLFARNRNKERAQVALVERSNHATWLDPKLATAAFQIGQTIGWRRLASLSAVALVAAGLAREWSGHNEPRS
jgi:chromate transport protein ChrA